MIYLSKKFTVVEHLRRARLLELVAGGKRLDGRELADYRPVRVKVNVIEKASGSAEVEIGETKVIAGVKVETGTPFPDTPDQGLLIVNAEVLPLASPYAEPGPPSEETVELARVVDRGIRESQMIRLSELVLIKGKRVYTVFVDIGVLNDDGNLFDASSYAAVSALSTSKMTKFEVTADGEVKDTGEFIPLPVTTLPISVTFAKIGDALLLDPNAEEETVMDLRLTLASDDQNNLCAGQKGRSGGLTINQLLSAAGTAGAKGSEIRELISGVVSNAKVGQS